ncbi:MAG: alanine--glyoxylate aminotransferase [Halobacteriovorax sp.]|nr:alanine--glyoxylate aminotransferase [Halobacteriovorax sp.]|tara:strand:+ start:127571 stop:128743 length:1173 start_codon:yes stop_codon:yes gene_type:complete
MINPPKDLPLAEIIPDEPLLLMGAGPVPIPNIVSQANGVVINHLGDTMNQVIDRVKLMAAYTFQTKSKKILGISGPASAAMEMAISNLVWSGRKILVLKMGTFSGRFAEMATAVGGDVTILENNDYKPFTKEEVEKELNQNDYDVITITQGETSCGLKNINLKEIALLAHSKNVLTIVDAVCTLSTMELPMDEWKLDVVVTGGQKGLSSIPGVSLIAFSDKAWKEIESRKVPCPHWCLDARKAYGFWNDKKYHYTAPVPGILALHEALRLICLESLESRFERHLNSSKDLQKGIESMGLELFIPEEFRLNSVLAIKLPQGINSHDLIEHMIKAYYVEISGAFGLDIIRIGQMGQQCRPQNIIRALYALGMSFKNMGLDLNLAAGMAALEQ